MNVFVLHRNPAMAAQMACDKHPDTALGPSYNYVISDGRTGYADV